MWSFGTNVIFGKGFLRQQDVGVEAFQLFYLDGRLGWVYVQLTSTAGYKAGIITEAEIVRYQRGMERKGIQGRPAVIGHQHLYVGG